MLVFLTHKVHTFKKAISMWPSWHCLDAGLSRPSSLSSASAHASPDGAVWLCRRPALPGPAASLPFGLVCAPCTWEMGTGSWGESEKEKLKRRHNLPIFFIWPFYGGRKLFFKAKFYFKHGLYLVFILHTILYMFPGLYIKVSPFRDVLTAPDTFISRSCIYYVNQGVPVKCWDCLRKFWFFEG